LVYRDNLLTRTFSNNRDNNSEVNEKGVEIAVQNLKNLDLLSDFENWNNLTNSIISLFDFPNVLYSRFQSHNYPFIYNPSDKEIDKLMDFLRFDIKTYNKIFFNKKLYSKNNINFNLKRNNNYYLLSSPLFSNDKKGIYLFKKDQYEKIIKKFQLVNKIYRI